jgi:hypothetical protein
LLIDKLVESLMVRRGHIEDLRLFELQRCHLRKVVVQLSC